MEDTLLFLLDLVDLLVTEAGLTHVDLLDFFARDLLVEAPLGHVLLRGDRLREMVQVLEPVLVSLVQGEFRPLHLQVEVDEACRARLCHRLVESVHRCGVARV